MKEILLFSTLLLLLLLICCVPVEKEYTTPTNSYELIGETNIEQITYYSIYTSANLEIASEFYYERLILESTKANKILLFYNDKKLTPTSGDLSNKRLFNISLIGGLEKCQGNYYILSYTDMNKLMRKGNIVDLKYFE